jgi:hypothetical protein
MRKGERYSSCDGTDRSAISVVCQPASCTRSNSAPGPRRVSEERAGTHRLPRPLVGTDRTRRWSPARCWDGALAALRRKPRCSASRHDAIRRSSDSGSGASFGRHDGDRPRLTVTECCKKGVVDKLSVLLRRPFRSAARRCATIACRPVRQHVRDLPDRRRDPALPGVDRPQRRADRARARIRKRPGHVAHERPA